jgi:hypothetical protein
MSSPVTLTGGAFQSIIGQNLVNGYLVFVLNQDAVANSSVQICAGYTVTIQLDDSGNAVSLPAQTIWGNDSLSPSNTFYMISGYSAGGQLVWGPNPGVITGTSPVSINTIPAPTFS